MNDLNEQELEDFPQSPDGMEEMFRDAEENFGVRPVYEVVTARTQIAQTFARWRQERAEAIRRRMRKGRAMNL